jgi:hypothetical protein
MDLRFLYNRIKYFIISPVKAWEVVHRESGPMKDVRGSFAVPLITLVSVCAFLGSVIFINTTLNPMYSVLKAIETFLLLYLGLYGSSFVVREITRALDLGHDFLIAFKLVAYSMAPIFLSLAVSKLFESLLFINLLGLYGFYIFWTGMEEMLNPADRKKTPMIIATAFSMIIIFGVLRAALSRLTEMLYFSAFA